jgi:hypothetical protein
VEERGFWLILASVCPKICPLFLAADLSSVTSLPTKSLDPFWLEREAEVQWESVQSHRAEGPGSQEDRNQEQPRLRNLCSEPAVGYKEAKAVGNDAPVLGIC